MEGVNSRFIFRSVEMRNQWGISQCEGKFALLWFHTVNNVDTITPCQHISTSGRPSYYSGLRLSCWHGAIPCSIDKLHKWVSISFIWLYLFLPLNLISDDFSEPKMDDLPSSQSSNSSQSSSKGRNQNAKCLSWRPLLPNHGCMQVALQDVPSVLDLYPFDVVAPGGVHLAEGYGILAQDLSSKGRVRHFVWYGVFMNK